MSQSLSWDLSIHACAKCGLPRRPHTYCDKHNCARPDRADGAQSVKEEEIVVDRKEEGQQQQAAKE